MRRALKISSWRIAAVGAFALVLSIANDARALGSCTFSTVSGASFGNYNVFNTSPLDTTASISFACLVGTNVTVNLSIGSGTSFSNRVMKNGASTLAYNLYMDAAHTQIWGDGTNGTFDYGPVTLQVITLQTLTVYGRIPALQNVPVGNYSDTVVVTLLF